MNRSQRLARCVAVLLLLAAPAAWACSGLMPCCDWPAGEPHRGASAGASAIPAEASEASAPAHGGGCSAAAQQPIDPAEPAGQAVSPANLSDCCYLSSVREPVPAVAAERFVNARAAAVPLASSVVAAHGPRHREACSPDGQHWRDPDQFLLFSALLL